VTSHAWFTAYAPARNPEIAVVVFVYGGGEGSAVALPIAGDVLRYYFGLETREKTDNPALTVDEPPPADTPFAARLLGADSWGGGGAAVTGFVLDKAGLPIPGITINVFAEGGSTPDAGSTASKELVAQVTSGPTGQFDFNAIDPARTPHWRLTLADHPNGQPLIFDAEIGNRYIVEFESGM